MKLKRKSLAEFKLTDTENGYGLLEGYANVFNVIDSYGDVTQKGSFAQDIAEFIKSGYLTIDHRWEMSAVIGDIVDAYEDERGLFFAAEFYSDENSQAVRRKIAERMERRKAVELSIGYWAMEEERGQFEGQKVNFLRRVRVREVSPVVAAANDASMVTAAKSRADEHEAAVAAVASYAERVDAIKELGRPDAWMTIRADELRDLGARCIKLADDLEPEAAPVEPAPDHDDDDAWALLAATGSDLPNLIS